MDLAKLMIDNETKKQTGSRIKMLNNGKLLIFSVKLSYRDHLELEFQILIFGNVHPFPNIIYEIWKYSSNCQYLEI